MHCDGRRKVERRETKPDESISESGFVYFGRSFLSSVTSLFASSETDAPRSRTWFDTGKEPFHVEQIMFELILKVQNMARLNELPSSTTDSLEACELPQSDASYVS